MEPASFGRKVGIGMRVAGRMLDERRRRREAAAQPASSAPRPQPTPSPATHVPATEQTRRVLQEYQARQRSLARGSKGFVSGITAPFARAGRALFYEIAGLFFALFGLFFAQFAYRDRTQYLTGPEHVHFLIYVALTLLFGYFSITSFLRARTVSGKPDGQQRV